MGWFGLGGGGEEDKSSSTSSAFDPGSSFDNSGSIDMSGSASSAPMGGDRAAMGAARGGGGFEQDLMMEQQKAMVQAVMARLTEMSFDQCVSKPSSSLSSSEKSCIQAVTNKYLDASEFTVARFSQGQQR